MWIAPGASTTVAGFTLRGLVYVGRSLPAANGGRNDNCLVDPGLSVAKANPDHAGQYLDYWPTYATMRPSSRRALLEWLAGDRSDPDTPIGYVFVYLYGLERRAVLEGSVEDRDAIRAEVERLIAIYGHNGSFDRYARMLLAALDIVALGPDEDPPPVFTPSGFDLPTVVRLAVGRRIRDGRPIEADWLLAWTLSHPETRVRTPARRAFDHLRGEFAAALQERHPSGTLTVRARKGRTTSLQYRAASGSFIVDLTGAEAGPLPDLARFSAPLDLGRELLDLCTARLDAYSRHLGRNAGAVSTLQAIALLPARCRPHALAEPVAADQLAWLSARAGEGAHVLFGEVSTRVAGRSPEKTTPARLRELADTLGRFGLGVVPDPRFPVRIPADARLLLFRLDATYEAIDGPSDAYRVAFLALALAVLVSRADGVVSDDERALLQTMISDAPGVAPGERCRLAAHARWFETHPPDVASLQARLADLGETQRRDLGDAVVRMATSDGQVHRAEVSLLEKIFRILGLAQDHLYAALHRVIPPSEQDGDRSTGSVRATGTSIDERSLVIPGPHPTALRPPESMNDRAPAAASASGGHPGQVDAARLAAIRAETSAVSSVLASVFDAEPAASDPGTVPEGMVEAGIVTANEGAFDGLEIRYATFLRELAGRAAWPRAEFDRLAREFGLMPGAALETLNDWAFARFDEALIEEGDLVEIRLDLIPEPMSDAA